MLYKHITLFHSLYQLRPFNFLSLVLGHFSNQNVSYQVLELPYKGDEFSLVLILPAEEVAIEEVEKLMTTKVIKDWFAGTGKEDEVEISLPRCVMVGFCDFSLSF